MSTGWISPTEILFHESTISLGRTFCDYYSFQHFWRGFQIDNLSFQPVWIFATRRVSTIIALDSWPALHCVVIEVRVVRWSSSLEVASGFIFIFDDLVYWENLVRQNPEFQGWF